MTSNKYTQELLTTAEESLSNFWSTLRETVDTNADYLKIMTAAYSPVFLKALGDIVYQLHEINMRLQRVIDRGM